MEIELQELEKLIEYHNDKYTNGQPEISDAEYDVLIDKLRSIDPENELLLTVGAPTPSYGKKVTHYSMMGSLMKIQNSIDEVNAWYNKYLAYEYVWSEKYDGVPNEIEYNKGLLINGSTRGNGIVGCDTTDCLKCIEGFPININYKDRLIIRGEFIMPLDKLNDVNKIKIDKGEVPFANTRNAVSGLLMSKDPTELKGKYLYFRVHRVMNIDSLETLTLEEQFINTVTGYDYNKNACRFRYVDLHIGELTQEKINDYVNNIRPKLNYLIDGLVAAVNNTSKRESYGYHGAENKYLKAAIAFKFAPDTSETTLIGVSWESGRFGVLFPVGILEPVDLSGCVIRRVSLHNHSEIKRLGLKIGCTVQICKSGDIIPVILKCLNDIGEEIIFPSNCPTCNGPIENDEKHTYCINLNCKDKLVMRIVHHLRTLEIKEIGIKLIEKLYDAGKLKKLSDIYIIEEKDVSQLDRSGEKTAFNFIKSITSATDIKLNKFLDSMGIESIGGGVSKLLVKRYKTLDNILKCTKEELLQIDGIGDILSESIVSGLEANKELIEGLRHILNVQEPVEITGSLKGKTFSTSGTLSIKRNDLIKIIESKGGEYISAKKGLSYFIVGEGAVPEKVDKARKLGAQIITETEFNELAEIK